MDAIDKSDIAEAFKGKLWTYVPVVHEQYKIGVAVANEPGYSPVPDNMTRDCGPSYKDARDYCDALNTERGQSLEASMDIVCSSMMKIKKGAAA